jgi:hypothetical protein
MTYPDPNNPHQVRTALSRGWTRRGKTWTPPVNLTPDDERRIADAEAKRERRATK